MAQLPRSLANQPQGAPAQFLETVSVFGTNSKADCERLIPYEVSYWTRMYAREGTVRLGGAELCRERRAATLIAAAGPLV